jgi:hypothetical protein
MTSVNNFFSNFKTNLSDKITAYKEKELSEKIVLFVAGLFTGGLLFIITGLWVLGECATKKPSKT